MAGGSLAFRLLTTFPALQPALTCPGRASGSRRCGRARATTHSRNDIATVTPFAANDVANARAGASRDTLA